jgi:predicted permease
VRASLGAGRLRIVRQLLTERLLLSLAGGGLGLLLAKLALDSAPSWLPFGTLPAVVQPELNWRVLAFSLLAVLMTGALCGLAPGLQAGRINLNEALRSSGYSTTSGNRLRRSLAAGEIAMAVVLVAGAALLWRTLFALEHVDRGYRADRILSFHVSLPSRQYGSPERINLFYQKALAELGALSGARSAAVAYDLPLEGWRFGEPFEVAGRSHGPAASRPYAHLQGVSTRYFETLEIPILLGRAFTETDTAKSAPVCIINDGLLREFFKGTEPIGAQLIRDGAPTGGCTIVGVSGQVKIQGPAEASRYELYVPYTQDSPSSVVFAVRAEGDPMRLAPAVREAMQRIDRDLPLVSLRTIDDIAANSVAQPRFRAALIGAFAVLALVLALIGIYGVLAYAVGQRTREFGIRMALGARTPDVLRLVLGDGLRITLAGVAMGLGAAAGLTGYLRTMLWGVKPLDPVTFVAVPAVLLIAGLAACYIPARRATKVDPLVALRYE